MSKQPLSSLMESLGHSFRDAGLLRLALTHPSAVPGDGGDNQRLEFLGDAVLELIVSEALYKRHAGMQEGQLTQLRASLVRETSLYEAARALGIGQYLRMDHGEEASGGRDKPSVLSDAMEAVIAAVYLDGGLAAARALVDRMLGDYEPTAVIEPNWKSCLQEREQAEGRGTPAYNVTGEDGPPHARRFTVQAILTDGRAAEGSGASKKQAEQQAARALMEAGR